MSDMTNLMIKFNQLQLICFWISEHTKTKAINTFDGKKGEIEIKIYEKLDSVKSSSIYKVDNIWVKSDKIVRKEMDNIVQHLLLIKNKYELH